MSSPYKITFNRPHATGRELAYIAEAIEAGHLSGDGAFTRRCHEWLQATLGSGQALLTHSCTGALEMAAILCDLKPGDEVIMPSFTFVSTANAVALRGAIPVFVEIREDTLNIDETLIEAAITPRTRAIFVVHYAGVACEMDTVMAIAARHDLVVVEDAAQGILARYKGKCLGTIGAIGALSFHETKNVLSGEGGAILLNDGRLTERAEVIREKGTNRKQFFRGMVDKYTWVDIGSSYLPSEIVAAFLYAQLEHADSIVATRLRICETYNEAFAALEAEGRARRPVVPAECTQNGHMFYLLLADGIERDALIQHLKAHGIYAPFHYVPLHSAPAGQRLGRTATPLPITDSVSERLVRLPVWPDMEARTGEVIEAVNAFFD